MAGWKLSRLRHFCLVLGTRPTLLKAWKEGEVQTRQEKNELKKERSGINQLRKRRKK